MTQESGARPQSARHRRARRGAASRPVLDARACMKPIAGHVVRAFLPGASSASVARLRAQTATHRSARSTRIHDAGLLRGLRRRRPAAYRLQIDWHGTPQETHDTYSFGPVLSRRMARPPLAGGPVCGARMPRLAAGHARQCRGRALRGVGAECAARVRGRRLQHVGWPPSSDAPASSSAGVWELFIPRHRRGHALQVRDRRRATATRCR